MSEQNNFQNWEPDKLSDYIVDNHHVYTRKVLPYLIENSKKAAANHIKDFPEMGKIAETIQEMADALEDHMVGEEKYLFPFVKKMLQAKRDNHKIPKPGFGTLDKPLAQHVKDHDHATELMQKIKTISKGYQLENNAPELMVSLYKKLKEFEKDLEQHIVLENEILFERCLSLEKEVVE